MNLFKYLGMILINEGENKNLSSFSKITNILRQIKIFKKDIYDGMKILHTFIIDTRGIVKII